MTEKRNFFKPLIIYMMTRNFFVLPLICMILSACEGETIDPTRASKSIRLTADIEGLKTRLSGSTWEKGDAIGVYMKKEGESLNSAVLENNINYIYNDAGNFFNPKDVAQTIYFPFNGSNVDFIGYYPFRSDINNFTYPVKLSSQSNQAAIDLMYSDNVVNRNMSNPNVNMTFSHQLSKLELQIAHYRNLELENLSVIITQVPTEASFDLANGTLTPSPATKDIALHVSNDGSAAEAILLPGTDLSASELWFIIGNNDQIYQSSLTSIIPEDTLAQSTLHSLNVTLFTDEEAAIVETGSIIPWTTLPLASDTATRTETVPPKVKGLITDPYTVTEAQAAQGELAVWVKGYIVGAFDGSIKKFVTDTTGQVRTNIALSDNMSEADISKMIPVQLPSSGAIRAALNIADNPGNINRLVLIKGDLADYYSVAGLEKVTDYQFSN